LPRPFVSQIACDEEGQASALEAMYVDLAPRIHRFLRDLLGDATLASDATQETFVRAFRRAAELPRDTRLVPCAWGSARRASLEPRRAGGRLGRVVAEGPPEGEGEDGAPAPAAELLEREAVHVVERALRALPEERRAVLVLRLDHDLSYDEIAQVM